VLIGLLTRAMALGAVTLNHFAIERILVAGKQVAGVVGTDALTGRAHEVRASSVVNASGPWLDDVIARSGLAHASPLFRPSRAFNLLTPQAAVRDRPRASRAARALGSRCRDRSAHRYVFRDAVGTVFADRHASPQAARAVRHAPD
jgi:glycerol-3-phosphate dehydrogenase